MSTTASFILFGIANEYLTRKVFRLVFTPYESLYAIFSPYIYHQSSIRHAINELYTLGYIEKMNKDGKKYISVTKKGVTYIQHEYSYLLSERIIDTTQWYFAIFDVPESKRTLRDEIRSELTNLGFRLWQRSTYILPFGIYGQKELTKKLTNESWKNHLHVVTVNSFILGETPTSLIEKLWLNSNNNTNVEALLRESTKACDQLTKKAANAYQKQAAHIKIQETLKTLFELIQQSATEPFVFSSGQQILKTVQGIVDTLQNAEIQNP